MRILANENFPAIAVEALRSAGHDVAWVRTDAPGCGDQEETPKDDIVARNDRAIRLSPTTLNLFL